MPAKNYLSGSLLFFLLIFTACETENLPTSPLENDTATLNKVVETGDIPEISASKINCKLPRNFEVFVPCANNGEGETVNFTGVSYYNFKTTTDRKGTKHYSFHIVEKGSGIGAESGETFRYSSQSNFNYRSNQESDTGTLVLFNRRVIRVTGTGTSLQYNINFLQKVVRKASGEFVIDELEATAECE